jgi:hypothetical protein
MENKKLPDPPKKTKNWFIFGKTDFLNQKPMNCSHFLMLQASFSCSLYDFEYFTKKVRNIYKPCPN